MAPIMHLDIFIHDKLTARVYNIAIIERVLYFISVQRQMDIYTLNICIL